jgi:hypothetical protein
MTIKSKLTLSLSTLIMTSVCFAANKTPDIITPDQITWKELPGHAELQYAVMAGNPLKKGPYTIRLKMPKDYSDVVHSHDQVHYDTIISGAYYSGFGDKIDRNNTQELVAGTFVTCPAHANHYGYTKEETVIQIAGNGPWEVLKSEGKHR